MNARSYHGNARPLPTLRWYSVRSEFLAALSIAVTIWWLL